MVKADGMNKTDYNNCFCIPNREPPIKKYLYLKIIHQPHLIFVYIIDFFFAIVKETCDINKPILTYLLKTVFYSKSLNGSSMYLQYAIKWTFYYKRPRSKRITDTIIKYTQIFLF